MTRLELARLRAARTKRVVAAASVVAFLATMGLARAAHPGQSTHAASTSASVTTSSSSVVEVPQVQTHVS